MISGDIFGRLIDGKRRRGCFSIDDSQEDARVSATEEGELSSEASTHPNVVLGSIRAKPELYDSKHVFRRKCRDLTLVQILGELVHPSGNAAWENSTTSVYIDLMIMVAQVQRRLSRGHRRREVWS